MAPARWTFLNGQITNELVGLRDGEGCYAAFLTHKGKMLGDLRVLAVGGEGGEAPAELLLDTERVALQELFDMIRRFKVGHEFELRQAHAPVESPLAARSCRRSRSPARRCAGAARSS